MMRLPALPPGAAATAIQPQLLSCVELCSAPPWQQERAYPILDAISRARRAQMKFAITCAILNTSLVRYSFRAVPLRRGIYIQAQMHYSPGQIHWRQPQRIASLRTNLITRMRRHHVLNLISMSAPRHKLRIPARSAIHQEKFPPWCWAIFCRVLPSARILYMYMRSLHALLTMTRTGRVGTPARTISRPETGSSQ